jgi:hypothetical protein
MTFPHPQLTVNRLLAEALKNQPKRSQINWRCGICLARKGSVMRQLCRTFFISLILATASFAAEEKQVELPEPDLIDGYSFSLSQKWWLPANTQTTFRPERRTPMTEICKGYLLLRLPCLARYHGWKETDHTDDPLSRIVFAAIRSRERRIAEVTNLLGRISYQQPGFRSALISSLDLKELKVMTRDDYNRTAPIVGSVVVWVPGKKTADILELRVLANVLEIFGGIVPVTVVFDETFQSPEIRLPKDDRGFSTAFIWGDRLRESFQGDNQQEIQGLLMWIWVILDEVSAR